MYPVATPKPLRVIRDQRIQRATWFLLTHLGLPALRVTLSDRRPPVDPSSTDMDVESLTASPWDRNKRTVPAPS
ncbi:hypothetical protein BHM03_00049768 [Ensete ventricosum]|nr:hypothetical protein BHM03_00049768 [Ensete ventricosum]